MTAVTLTFPSPALFVLSCRERGLFARVDLFVAALFQTLLLSKPQVLDSFLASIQRACLPSSTLAARCAEDLDPPTLVCTPHSRPGLDGNGH